MTVDESFFKKITLWGNIVIGTICYCMFFFLCYISMAKRGGSFFGALLFLIFAMNCTWRVRSYYKIERMRKDTFSEKEIAKAERRSGIVNSIFSNATIGFYMLLMAVVFLFSGQKNRLCFTAFCAVLALCFIALFAINLRNLKRFDRL